MKKIPLKLQWGMLENIVGKDIVSKVKNDLKKRTKKLKYHEFKVIRKEKNEINIFGDYWGKIGKWEDTVNYMIKYNLKGNLIENYMDIKNKELREASRKNIYDAEKIIEKIDIYSDTVKKAAKKIGKKLKPVDKKEDYQYIDAKGNFLLSLKAKLMGADAIVNYSEKKYRVSMGTAFSDGMEWAQSKKVKHSMGIPVKYEK